MLKFSGYMLVFLGFLVLTFLTLWGLMSIAPPLNLGGGL